MAFARQLMFILRKQFLSPPADFETNPGRESSQINKLVILRHLRIVLRSTLPGLTPMAARENSLSAFPAVRRITY
jgi:hypothetical protein